MVFGGDCHCLLGVAGIIPRFHLFSLGLMGFGPTGASLFFVGLVRLLVVGIHGWYGGCGSLWVGGAGFIPVFVVVLVV